MIGNNNKVTFCFEDFYPSNIPYNHILKDIIEECCNQGLNVKVVTAFKQNDKEQKLMMDFFKTKKIKSSLFKAGMDSKISSIVFSARVFFHLLLNGRGTVLIPSTPPAIMGFSVFLARFLGGFRFNYVYHCQDIHPEALVISNNLSKPIIISILRFFDWSTVRYAKNVIVLSEDMKSTLLKRYKKPLNNISVINNFTPSSYQTPSKILNGVETIRKDHSDCDCIFVFAGNIGAFQNLDILLEGFLRLEINATAHLYLIGEGQMKSTLTLINSNHTSEMRNNVHFLDKMKSDIITQFISNADYGVVSISEGLLDVAYPSKISTYLSLGLPLLLCGGKESGIEQEIVSESLGLSIDGKNIGLVTKGFEEAIARSIFFRNDHQKIKQYYQANYEREKTINNIITILKDNKSD